MNISGIAKIVRQGYRISKSWIHSHRHTIITIATATADVGAIIYMGVNTEKAADEIEKKKKEKGEEPTVLEKAVCIAKVDWPAGVMVGGSTFANIMDKKSILSQSAALAVNLANQTKANEALNKAIDDNLSSKDKKKVHEQANTEIAKAASKDGAWRDYVPSMGRGTQLVLYNGILFKADVNDIIAAYEDIDRRVNDIVNGGLATRWDLLNAICKRAGGIPEKQPWYEADILKSMGWSCFTDEYGHTEFVDVHNNINDEGSQIWADQCGFTELGKEPILVLDDDAELIPENAWRAYHDNGGFIDDGYF